MLSAIREASYFPTIKWKEGERGALASSRPPNRSLIIPLVIVPPAGEFDHDTKRILSPAEHILAFGPRLEKAWGRRPAFVDASLIDETTNTPPSGAHALTELLERARLSRATACPITSLNRSAAYQNSVRRFVRLQLHLPICIKLSAAHLVSHSLQQDLEELLISMECPPSRVLLVLDFGSNIPGSEDEIDDFVELLIARCNDLPYLHEWLNVVVSMTSFPIAPKIKAGKTEEFARVDWMIFQQVQLSERLLRMPAFGDYAVDAEPFRKVVGRIIPSAQLRHSSDKSYTIVKGKQVKKPVGYAEIFPVADRLVALKGFPRGTHSDGDSFVRALAQRSTTNTGGASKWRWAATDHHFSLVTEALGASPEMSVSTEAEPADNSQGVLFRD